jgi:hypothetical protein
MMMIDKLSWFPRVVSKDFFELLFLKESIFGARVTMRIVTHSRNFRGSMFVTLFGMSWDSMRSTLAFD